MCFQLRDALRVGCIGLSKHFFSISMDKREMLKVMDDELRNFSILVEAPKTPSVLPMPSTQFFPSLSQLLHGVAGSAK